MEKRHKGRLAQVICALGIAALGVGILLDSANVAQGVRSGLTVCGNVLIPALFPFMVLAGFLSRTRYARVLSWPLTPITTRVYKLPGELGAVVLLSLIGGYPVGARMIANLLADGRISAKTAERMLCFCCNCGPSFLISAVGAGMLMNRRAGVILFATQTAATLLIGAVVSRRARLERVPAGAAPNQKGAAAFVSAVSVASTSMILMCAFAILFSALLALMESAGVVAGAAAVLPLEKAAVAALFSGLLEVTSGCLRAAEVGGAAGFGLISAFVSFSGLSVLFQVMSSFGGSRLRFRPFVLSRIAHAALSTAMALPLYRALCGDQMAWLPVQPPILQADNRSWIISVCLLAMCSILVLSIDRQGGTRCRK